VDPRDRTWGEGGDRDGTRKKKRGRKKSRPESAWASWEDDFDL